MSTFTSLGLGNTALLKPVVALAGWTFVMQTWMHLIRLPAIPKYGIRGEPEHVANDMRVKFPVAIRQVGDNYNHLHEQPTVFYAVILGLALVGDGHDYTNAAAWTYVGIRVGHSVYQANYNQIMTRFPIFVAGSLVLLGLTARLAVLVY